MDSVIIDYLTSKGYAPCDYILSTGSQYIDTAFKPNQDTRIIMDVKGYSNTSNVWAFCARDTCSLNNLGVFYYVQKENWSVDYSTSGNRQGFEGIGSSERLYIDHNKNVTTINNVTKNNTYTEFQPSCNLVLLACNTAGTISGYMKAYLYSCKIYDNDTLIRDYVPAKDPSGYFGLYDLVNDEFYRSAAGNNFEGNPIIIGVQYVRNFRSRLLASSNKVGYENQYLTIEAFGSGSISWGNANLDSYTNPIYYSKNGSEWVGSTEGSSVTVVSGDKVRFKTVRTSPKTQINIGGNIEFDVYGNIMSLVYGDNFIGQTSIFSYAFQCMFENSLVRDASNLILAAVLANGCYYNMFQGCTSLTKAPELSATTLASDCYNQMFDGCTSLTTAPELPATTLDASCYGNMFRNCTSLTTAPELPATTLAPNCYFGMFTGCTSLVTAPELPATTLATYCYSYMFDGCSSLISTPELPATILANYCYIYMFRFCTSLTAVPDLPATVISYDSYEAMFYGCSSLESIVLLAQSISGYGCQYMFYNCRKLKRITMLATSIGTDGLRSWVKGVSSTGTFVKHPNMTTLPSGDSGIPSGWTVQNSDGSPVTGGGSSGGGITTANISWSVQTGDWKESYISSAYDGKQFMSVSPGHNGSTRLRCTFSGVTYITFNCVYYGEPNYDYLTVGNLDSTCTRVSYGTTLIGTSGTAQDITFSCDSGTHYVEFCYSKDGSVDEQLDCAVVYIKNCS